MNKINYPAQPVIPSKDILGPDSSLHCVPLRMTNRCFFLCLSEGEPESFSKASQTLNAAFRPHPNQAEFSAVLA
jgi:hypothetical protein